MIITDLNYLQSADDNIEGGYYFGPSSKTLVTAKITEVLDIKKNFVGKTLVIGNFAGAEATANAMGKDTSTQAISSTTVVQGKGSSSNATSVSATNGYYFRW
ncbi:hypothetical protein HJG54_19425 [Leptolyngbya sp. NK1-12]|uniref:Uncharacterized protein n=1 Tax=Leptolyngbya sp. NK1-12 TaxID=2547451 RepID=A0AA96WM31_9CYAN|nr:hypothetical protein [Leptolyngbya sp. NK1-12]MBF2047344.1 hypothetical protein [Elainella sp. C42_A2020_010]WNZ24801.1 hypothetical protein HJG54_19425 [Leptolyngbya sp. NK1-12]